MTVYRFTRDATPPLPGSGLNRTHRLKNNQKEFAQALVSGAAWERFCDGLRSAGRSILRSEDAVTDSDLAEGFQYLLGLTYNLIEQELYRTDAHHPAFLRVQSDVVKVAMDNPDGALISAPVSDDGVFTIYGQVGPIRLLEFVISGSARPAIHYLDEFDIQPDGRLEVTLSRERRPGNWIELPIGARSVLVRRAFYNWEMEEVPRLAIVRVDADEAQEPLCLRRPTAAEVGEKLDAISRLAAESADYWIDMVHSFRDEGDNVIPAPRPLASTGMNAMRSSAKGFFVLQPHEALLIEFTPPEGLFWSISIGDIWFRTIDFSHHQTSLNGHQAEVDQDGVCRVVVAHEDPGVPNWLDTVGHERGVIIIRWVMVSDRPQPHTRVVSFSDIPSLLPAETRKVSELERMASVATRTNAVARRLAVPLTTRWSYSTAAIEPKPPSQGPTSQNTA